MHAANRTVPYDFTCKVADHRDVSVQAGTFPAFHIQCTTNIGNEETYWVSSELGVFLKTSMKRSAASPLGEGTQEAELIARPVTN
jgi:hypothetical protein